MQSQRKLGGVLAAAFAGLGLILLAGALAGAEEGEQIQITGPGSGEIVQSGDVPIHIHYPKDVIGAGGKAIHILIDGEAPQHFDPTRPDQEFTARGLAPGSHIVRAFVVGEQHLIADPKAPIAIRTFAVKEKTPEKLPKERTPLLTLNLPLASEPTGAQGVPIQFIVTDLDGKPVSNAQAYKLRCKIAGKEQLVNEGALAHIEGVKAGMQALTCELLDPNGKVIENGTWNRVTRRVQVGGEAAQAEPSAAAPLPAGRRQQQQQQQQQGAQEGALSPEISGAALALEIASPTEGQMFQPGQAIPVEVQASGAQLPPGWVYVAAIDNLSPMVIESGQKFQLPATLPPGTHVLRVVVARPNLDVLQQESAYSQVNFHVGKITAPSNAILPGDTRPSFLLVSPLERAYPEGRPIPLSFFLRNAARPGATGGATTVMLQYRVDSGPWRKLDRPQFTTLPQLPAGRHTLEAQLVNEQGQVIPGPYDNTYRRTFTVGGGAAAAQPGEPSQAPAQQERPELRGR
jgi:hypothetical protein